MRKTDSNNIKYIMYLRKSSEDEERQVASLPAQEKELKELIAREKLKVVGRYEESQSAHKLGRPLFNEMVERINNGEANGILVWHLNRIARNALDGGMIVHLLDTELLKEIRTPSIKIDGEGNDKLILQIEFAMSKKYSDDLSEIVKRGIRQKVEERREWCGLAKPGYINFHNSVTNVNTVRVDPERFPLIQRAMQLILSGEYSPNEALHKLNTEMQYKTPQRRKFGNCPMPKGTFYKILSDPYYYGLVKYSKYEPVIGTHKPMITKKDFDEMQVRLGRTKANYVIKHDHPFRSMLKCGECGSAIVAQEKWQIICTLCKKKFAKSKARTKCPNCNLEIKDMMNPKVLHYIYYSCTKKKNTNCNQRSTRIENLDDQVDAELQRYTIPEEFKDWAIKYLHEVSDKEAVDQLKGSEKLHKEKEKVQLDLKRLVDLFIGQGESEEYLSKDLYKSQKKDYEEKLDSLDQLILQATKDQKEWVELTEKTFNFACYARYWFKKGDSKTKSLILKTLGKNLNLTDGKVSIDQHKPFFLIEEAMLEINDLVAKIEPEEKIDKSIQLLGVPQVVERLSGW